MSQTRLPCETSTGVPTEVGYRINLINAQSDTITNTNTAPLLALSIYKALNLSFWSELNCDLLELDQSYSLGPGI